MVQVQGGSTILLRRAPAECTYGYEPDATHMCLAGYCDVLSALPLKHPLPHLLLVANNPSINAAQWHWLSAIWTVVRFNDCKANWPPATDAVTEMLFLRDNGISGYQGERL